MQPEIFWKACLPNHSTGTLDIDSQILDHDGQVRGAHTPIILGVPIYRITPENKSQP